MSCRTLSGFEDILVESSLYGTAVVCQVMKGKAFNRSVRVHKLLNEAMHRLRWEACCDWIKDTAQPFSQEQWESINTSVDKCLQVFSNTNKEEDTQKVQTAVKEVMIQAEPLMQMMGNFTELGKNSSYTFTFWNNYLSDMSQLLLDYIAAKRDDNRDMELETFSQMLPYDFMCGHLNYAKWGTVNVAEGYLLQEKKPEVYQALSNGNWSVHHSQRPFSGVWHDMAIEQSLNKDCGKHRHLYSKETALNKYYLTSHLKAEVKAATKLMSGIRGTKSTHKEECLSRMNKDESAIQEIVNTVKERMINPFAVEPGFSSENKQPLLNIATSSVLPDDRAKHLCNVRSEGVKEMDKFIQSRLSSQETEFFSPMKRPTLHTFASLNKRVNSQRKQSVQQLNVDRQIFSRLTVIAQSRDIDIKGIMEYELAPVPLSLFNLDGSMRKTAKNMTLTWMEKDYAVNTPPQSEEPTLFVVDFMMVLRMILSDTSCCKTFGELSDTILSVVLGHGYRYTAVVGDAYCLEESIKAAERSRRGSVQMQEIYNPSRHTPLPKQKSKMLSNPKNKSNLVDFIMTDWIGQCQDALSNDKQVYLSGGFKYPRRAVVVHQGSVRPVAELESDHEEADSRMFLHINHAVEVLDIKRFVLWSIDSDVAAMCPRFCKELAIEELHFKTGVGHRKRYIPMHTVAEEIGVDMSQILPTVHALSGCDSTSAFSGVGKRKWISCVADHPHLINGMKQLGQHASNISEEAVESSIALTSLVYNRKKMANLNQLRYELFCSKKANSEKLPPTMDAFMQHLKRVNYQSFIWLHAHQKDLNLPNPADCGWKLNESGQLVPDPMTKAAAPDTLLVFVECACKGNCETRRCRCRREDMVCSDLCGCDVEICENRLVEQFSESDEDSDN